MNEAADFMDHESAGLGSEFLEAVERAVEQVRSRPEAAQPIYRNIRRKLVAHFPFSVIYLVRHERIRVLAVAHQRRRPHYWRSRKW
jgi:plasmid stabilization system protein ParE